MTIRVIALIVCGLLLTACTKSGTPQAQVRKTVAQAETAAANKDVAVLRAMVSEKYTDTEGRDKKAVEAVLRYYFLRSESIHLFTSVRNIEVLDSNVVRAVANVAMASQPVKSAKELEGLRADLYRFEITFGKEGDHWRATKAEWRPAELMDFL